MIAMSVSATGIDRVRARLRSFQSRLPAAVGEGLASASERASKEIAREIERESRLGRGLYVEESYDAALDVEVIEPRNRDGAVQSGLRLKGIARLMELGGRIRQHRLGQGTHPGAEVRRYGFARRQLEREPGRAATGIRAGIARLIGAVFG